MERDVLTLQREFQPFHFPETTDMQTTDHDTIKQWVEDRGGVPAVVTDTADDDGGGLLRIDFPDADGVSENLSTISWEQFFETFEDSELAFLYQEETSDGETSRFNKFVAR